MDDLLDNAPCGFVVFTDDGIITKVNHTAARLLGYEKDDLQGIKFDLLLNIAGRIFYQTHFFPLITLHGKAEEIFLTFLSRDKAEIPVLINAKRIEKDDTAENHCVLIPVYQRRKYEQELLQARRSADDALNKNELLLSASTDLELSKIELDRQVTRLSTMNEDLVQFSNVISHDMQEPIRKIAMFADIIQRENYDDLADVSKIAIDKIKAASHKMRNLIICLQQYVSVDVAATKHAQCNLNQIIAAARIRAISDMHDQDVTINSNELPAVEGHCDQFELLFYHLIRNAIQFKKENAPTVINIGADIIQQNSYRTTQNKYRYVDCLRLKFSDEGKGFKSEYQDYVFQLFKKAHNEATGLGFGLALCKKIVENHYGYISVKSALDEGTAFTILLPLEHV